MSTRTSPIPRPTRRASFRLLALVGGGLLLVACGSSDGHASAPIETVTVTETVTIAADAAESSSDPSAEDTDTA